MGMTYAFLAIAGFIAVLLLAGGVLATMFVREMRKLLRGIRKLAQVYFPHEHLSAMLDGEEQPKVSSVTINKPWDEDEFGRS